MPAGEQRQAQTRARRDLAIPDLPRGVAGAVCRGTARCANGLVQARAFEEAIALARFDAELHGLAVAIDRDRHFDARLALRPDAAEQAGEIADLFAGHREHDIADAYIGAFGGSAISEADHHQPVFHFGRIQTEPGPGRRVAP